MGIFNNQAALNFNTDQQIDTMLDYWNYAEAQMTTRDEVTDHMFDRLDAFVIGPKFGRAYRRAKNMANNGPHQSLPRIPRHLGPHRYAAAHRPHEPLP